MNIENLKTKAEADISEYITKKIIEFNLMYSIIKFIHKPRFYGVLLYLNGSEYLNHNC